MSDDKKLTTFEEYEALPPFEQGFIVYMEEEQPGSELKGQENPYPAGSSEDRQWRSGQLHATLLAQDSEE